MLKRISFKKIIALAIFLPIVLSAQVSVDGIIPPLKLIAGQADIVIISDLFYSDNYDVTFKNGNGIDIRYEKENLKLSVLPDSSLEGIKTIEFQSGGDIFSIPVYIKKLVTKKITFKPGKLYKFISLFGSFNNWDRQNLPMTDKNSDGIYEITIQLEPGRYEYKFYADGEEILDLSNPEQVPNGIGGINSVTNIANPHGQKIFLHKTNYSSDQANSKFQFYLETEQSIEISQSNFFVFVDNKKVAEKNISIEGKFINVSIPNEELTKAKMLRAAFSQNGLNSNLQMVPLENGKPADGKSFDWYKGIIYSLMIDRFYDGDKNNDAPVQNDSVLWKANYMGGDFSGITQKINDGYFDSLHVNTIWLSPVYDNPNDAYKEYPAPHRWYTGYHGYWPISSNNVEEKFGMFSELKNLIDAAHNHNIKILLDFVSHHVHKEHPYFKEHPDWFGKLELPDGKLNLRLWDEQRLTTWFEPYLPSFNFVGSQKAIDVVSDNAIWWLEKTGADGFRHDAVKHVPNIFWRTLTRKLKSEIEIPSNKKVYQIGETFGNYDLVGSYVNNGQLSAQFNFELYNVAQAVFIDPNRSFKDLDNEMKKSLDVFGSLHLMGNIMDSHDKNRFMAYADGAIDLSRWSAIEEGWSNPPEVKNPYNYKKAELYYAYMFSVPGLPVIYYGSEFGMTGLSDPDNRRMMRFGNQLSVYEKEMLDEVKKIVKVRSESSALNFGDFYTLQADSKIYSFIRSDFYERVLVVLNKTDERQNIEINLPEIYSSKKVFDLIKKDFINVVGNKINVNLDGRGWIFLRIE
jgi:cyclomaltodextrinase / maltogenic alpha-amylase / neopullulanase